MTRAEVREAAGRDRRTAWIAAAAAWIVVAAFVAGKAARDAILLAHFDVARLPVFVGAAAALSLPIVIAAGRAMARLGPRRAMAICQLGSAALLVVDYIALARWPAPAAVAVYVQISALGALQVSGFWSIVNERFDARTAKRWIARIGMAATLGGIAGGVIAERTAVLLSAERLLLVLAGLHLAAALALRLIGGGGRPAQAASRPRQAFQVIARSSLLRNLAAIVVLGAVAATLLDFVLKARIAASGGVLRSLGLYYTGTAIVTAVAQLALGGRLIARLGVPRSVAALPVTVAAFGGVALVAPALWSAALARGAEAVTRSSVYRLAYELLFAPLPEHQKRPTKVVLDVGAERVGDLLGAQLVGVVMGVAASPWPWLTAAAIAAATVALGFAARVPRSYQRALAHQLKLRAPAPAFEPWQSLTELPIADAAGDRGDRIADLRSADAARVRHALASPLAGEHVPEVIALLAWDEVAPAAHAALAAGARRWTDPLVAALLDGNSEFAVRRRLPSILVAGDPALAIPGLWRGLDDERFEVRYRSGTALAQLVAAGHALGIGAHEVLAAVNREISVDLRVWRSHRLLDAPGDDAVHRVLARRSSAGLAHVFTLLGFALPAQPLRLALQAVHAADRALRATALEYLESILPAEIRVRLWPFLEADRAAPEPSRSRTDVLASLERAHPSIGMDLAAQPAPEPPKRPSLKQLNADWTRATVIARSSHNR